MRCQWGDKDFLFRFRAPILRTLPGVQGSQRPAPHFVLLSELKSPPHGIKATDEIVEPFLCFCSRWVHVSDGRCVHPRGGAEYPPDDTPLLLEDCAPYNPGRIRFKGRPDRALWNIEHIRSGEFLQTRWPSVHSKPHIFTRFPGRQTTW